MTAQPNTLPIDWADPSVVAAKEAERRLFDHYGLEYSVHFVELVEPRIRIRVLEVGSGAPLVLLPGGSGEAIQYVPLIAAHPDRRYIIPNLPGGGMSDAVDFRQVDLRQLAVTALTAVLDHFELDRAPIGGSSMGGLWTLWMALARPERVAAMVQFGCPALVLGTSAPLPMRLLSVPGINRILFPLTRAGDPVKVRKMLGMLGCSDAAAAALPDVFAEALARMFSLPTYRLAWTSLMRSVLRPRGARAWVQLGAEDLTRVACPTLFIWGDADPFGGLDIGRRCVAAMPNATLEVVRGGHVPIIDNARECATLLGQFLPANRPTPNERQTAAWMTGV